MFYAGNELPALFYSSTHTLQILVKTLLDAVSFVKTNSDILSGWNKKWEEEMLTDTV